MGQPHSSAEGSPDRGRVPPAPPDPPEPCTEYSLSVPAAPTHGRPGDLRGERSGRGVPANSGGGAILVPGELSGTAWDGHPGKGRWKTRLAGRDGMGAVGAGNGDGAQGFRTQPLLSSTQTTAKGLPRRVPSASDTDPALQVRGGRGAPVSEPQSGLRSRGSSLSPSPGAQHLRLCLPRAPRPPRPSRPKGAMVLPGEGQGVRGPTGTHCAKSRWCKSLFAQDLNSSFGVWVEKCLRWP